MAVPIRVLPMGDAAVLAETDDVDAVLALAAAVAAARDAGAIPEVIDVVPAARTLLVTVARGTDLGPIRAALGRCADRADPGALDEQTDEVVIAVRYDGPDLDAVAKQTGLSRAEVVTAHTGSSWRVGFGGFAPGFAYLVGGDPRLEVSRRADPRTSVPAGSVALAGLFSAVYPQASPGGWQLIGSTDAPMWDVDRDPPALLRPGQRVRFVEAD